MFSLSLLACHHKLTMVAGMAIRDNGRHPDLPQDSPKYLKETLEAMCFVVDPNKRASFADIVDYLAQHGPKSK